LDLNQLLYHHQIALMRKSDDEAPQHCGSRFDLVSHYERRISKLRQELGTTQYPNWPDGQAHL